MNRPAAILPCAGLLAAGLWLLPRFAGLGQPLEALASAGLATVHAAIAIGIGLALLQLTRCPFKSSLAEGGLACFLGAGVLSLAVLGLGLAGHATAGVLRALATGAALAVSPHVVAWLGRFRRHIRPLPTELPAVAIGTVLFALLLLHAAAPPMAFDVLEYHLAAPGQWLRAGVISPLPGNFFSHLPFLAEMNYLLALALGGGALPSTPAMLNLWGLLAALSLVLALGDINGIGRSVRGAAALLVLSTPLIFKICTDALVDIWVVLGTLSAVYAWHRWIITRRIGALLIAALAVGFLATVKLPALVIWVAPLLVFFLYTLIAHRLCPAEWIISFVVVAVVAAVPILPWALKEAAWSGNPVFPLAYGMFGGEGWSGAQAELLIAGHGLRSPLMPSYWLDLWHRRSDLGPCPLSLALGAILFARRRHAQGLIGSVLVMALGAGLLWNLLGHSPDRFVAPAVALLVPLGFGGLWTCVVLARHRWGRGRARWGVLVALVPLLEMAWTYDVEAVHELTLLLLAAALVLALPLAAKRAEPSTVAGLGAMAPAGLLAALILASELMSPDSAGLRLGHVLGQRTRSEVLRGLPHFQVYDWLNEIERPAGRVLLVYESRAFGLRPPSVLGTVFDGQPLREFVRDADGLGVVLERLRQAGFSHALVNFNEMQRLGQFYFGGSSDPRRAVVEESRPLWDFPSPLSSEEWERILEFHHWALDNAALNHARVVAVRL